MVIKKRILLVSIPLLILMAGASAALIGTNNTPSDRLVKAASVAESIDSYTFEIQTTQTQDGISTNATTRGSAVVGMGIAVTGFTDRGEYEETVLLEGFEYYRNAPNDEWQVRTSRFSPGNIAPINAMTHLKYTSELTGSEEIGEDFYRGVEVIKIAGNSVMETKAERLFPDPQSWSAEQEAFHSDARSQFLLGSEEVEVWIGEEDDLVRKVIVVANFPEYGKEEAYSFVAEMTFSDFNQTSFEIPVTQ